jgi:hypothetical protein
VEQMLPHCRVFMSARPGTRAEDPQKVLQEHPRGTIRSLDDGEEPSDPPALSADDRSAEPEELSAVHSMCAFGVSSAGLSSPLRPTASAGVPPRPSSMVSSSNAIAGMFR